MTKVKICGITNLADALLAAKFGADALGFNFYEKSPRYIVPEKAREIIEQLPENILKVGVFVNESLDKIVEIAEITKLDALQLHGEETPEFACELKSKTNLEIIKAFRVSPEFKPEDVLKYETDAILLDAYNPQEHGGTGEIFDWKIARKVQEIFPKMYLAGGLSPKNIADAIKTVHPFGVDSCSLLEFPKAKKDLKKVSNFIRSSRHASRDLSRLRVADEESITVPDDIFEFLDTFFRKRPKMFLGEKKFAYLFFFLLGHRWGYETKNTNMDSSIFFYLDFKNFVAEKLGISELTEFHWSKMILDTAEDDEEKAFDIFFEILDKFKLEREDLSNE